MPILQLELLPLPDGWAKHRAQPLQIAGFVPPEESRPIFQWRRPRQVNTFTFLLCQCQRTSKQRLLFGAEKLLWLQFVLARVRTVKKPQVQRDYVLLVSIDLIERRPQV